MKLFVIYVQYFHKYNNFYVYSLIEIYHRILLNMKLAYVEILTNVFALKVAEFLLLRAILICPIRCNLTGLKCM